MTVTKRLGVVLGAIALWAGSLAGQEVIENWPAPPSWSPRVPIAAPEDGSLSALAADVIPTPPLPFVAVNPCRIADTRGLGFTGQAGPPALVVATPRAFQIGGTVSGVPTQCGIPVSAQAVSFQFTVTGMNTAGNLIAWPEGPPPTTSVLNWNANSVAIGSGTVVPLSATGALNVQLNGGAGASTQLIIDVNGYYGGSVVTSVAAGTGLTGGGTGAVTLGIAAGGVGSTELATGAVTSTKIGANAVTAGAIAANQVVKSLNGLRDTVALAGSGGITVTPGAGTITIGTTGSGAPAGSFLLGNPGDTDIIGAGYTEVGPSSVDFWSPTTLTGAPSTRASHTAVLTGTRMIVWGGNSGGTVLNTGGRYDPVTDTWAATTTTGAPVTRNLHTAVWTGTVMIVWGGTNLGDELNSGGRYDPVANTWAATTTTGAPVDRRSHTAVWTGTRMIVWGGSDDPSLAPLNTGGLYDPIANLWTATSTTGAPTARTAHEAVWTGTRMIVWGGSDGTMVFPNTGARYDPAANTWQAMTTISAPAGRPTFTATWTGTFMFVWGGFVSGPLDTGGRYDPVGDDWFAVTSVGAPPARSAHTAVWTGSRVIIWGGGATGANTNTGGQYDPVGNFWAPTTTAGAPGPRRDHTAVWTGSRMIVWGGTSNPDYFNTGGQYGNLSLYVKN